MLEGGHQDHLDGVGWVDFVCCTFPLSSPLIDTQPFLKPGVCAAWLLYSSFPSSVLLRGFRMGAGKCAAVSTKQCFKKRSYKAGSSWVVAVFGSKDTEVASALFWGLRLGGFVCFLTSPPTLLKWWPWQA